MLGLFVFFFKQKLLDAHEEQDADAYANAVSSCFVIENSLKKIKLGDDHKSSEVHCCLFSLLGEGV